MWQLRICSVNIFGSIQGVQIDEKEYLWYLLRIRCVPFFMLSGLALTKVEKSKAPGYFLGGQAYLWGACFAGGIELGNERLSLVSYRCFSTVSFLYSCVFYDPEILL